MGLKLGSLFDGSGGFPLAGALFGIEPVWASEIEPYPIRVTTKRFPGIKHLGDVTKINGAEIEPVDIITFGSPCQDLSVAGKQLGIHDGQRSNLFFEAIRIIKEMRDATANIYPRFAVWENVPGAFSSHKGEDFRAVLEAFRQISDGGGYCIPGPANGKWAHAGTIVGDGWSLAWRLYDAQFWGVPQRRKRIYLVADFGGECAGEILFESESMCGNPAESGAAREGTAADAKGSAGGSDSVVYSLHGNAVDLDAKMNGCGWCENVSHSLNTQDRHAVAFMGGQGAKAGSIAYRDDGKTPTLRATNSGSNQVPDVVYGVSRSAMKGGEGSNGGMPIEQNVAPTMVAQGSGAVVYDARGNGDGTTVPTLTGDHENRITDYTALATFIQPAFGDFRQDDIAQALKASDHKRVDPGAMVLNKGKPPRKYIVRRLTPLECCRLQGFPDWWTDGVEGSDSAQYKMWGNGIALPCAADVIGRLAMAIQANI